MKSAKMASSFSGREEEERAGCGAEEQGVRRISRGGPTVVVSDGAAASTCPANTDQEPHTHTHAHTHTHPPSGLALSVRITLPTIPHHPSTTHRPWRPNLEWVCSDNCDAKPALLPALLLCVSLSYRRGLTEL